MGRILKLVFECDYQDNDMIFYQKRQNSESFFGRKSLNYLKYKKAIDLSYDLQINVDFMPLLKGYLVIFEHI